MNDPLRLIILLVFSPLIGLVIVCYGILIPICVVIMFIGWCIYSACKREAK